MTVHLQDLEVEKAGTGFEIVLEFLVKVLGAVLQGPQRILEQKRQKADVVELNPVRLML